MPKRAERLKTLIHSARKTADATQKAMLRAEDRLTELEDRDARRQAREPK